jgi:hypothetical protein
LADRDRKAIGVPENDERHGLRPGSLLDVHLENVEGRTERAFRRSRIGGRPRAALPSDQHVARPDSGFCRLLARHGFLHDDARQCRWRRRGEDSERGQQRGGAEDRLHRSCSFPIRARSRAGLAAGDDLARESSA